MRILMIIALLICAMPVHAQQNDRGILQRFLEDRLSSAGRTVTIQGFSGALSSQANVELISIADAQGVWITLRNVRLDWSRAALLAGRLEVNELSAEQVDLPRMPMAANNMPNAEAQVFQLPELPVSINIGTIAIAELVLGQPVIGTAASLSLDGSLSLAGGAGNAALQIRRIDGQRGDVTLDAAYANDTQQLRLNLDLTEGPDGIAANLLRLPDRPALSLRVRGDAPLSDFTADIALSSDGTDRFAGQVRLTADTTQAGVTRGFSANLGGDIAPLFAPRLRPFFGPEMRLSVSGTRNADGSLDLPLVALSSTALNLRGSLQLAAGGLPQKFDLQGRIAGDGPVLLPVSGPDTYVDSVEISAAYDAAQGDGWTARLTAEEFIRGGYRLSRALLSGSGTIAPVQPGRITANIGAEITGLVLEDAALSAALGTDLRAGAVLEWQDRNPITVSALSITGAGLAMSGQGTIDGIAKGVPIDGRLRLTSDDISRFSGLAGRPLAGAARMDLQGSGTLLGGAFDLELDALTRDLAVGIAQIDPLLTGESRLNMRARRDQAGTVLDLLALDNDAARLRATGSISSEAGDLTLSARLADLATALEGISGPANLDLSVNWLKDQPVQIDTLTLTAGDDRLQAQGTLDLDDPARPLVGSATLKAGDLSRFAEIAKRRLRGAIEMTARGSVQLQGQGFDLDVVASGGDLTFGLGDFDRLLSGKTDLSASASRSGGLIRIGHLDLTTPQGSAQVQGAPDGSGALNIRANLRNLGVIVPDFPGPATVSGTATPDGDNWVLDIDATGPGGTTGRIEGRMSGNGQDADLGLSGSAPLGLANSFIAPRSIQGTARYDLRLNGKPGLAALSGTVSTADARVAAPTLGLALQGLRADIRLADSQADITAAGSVVGGGTVDMRGQIGLTAPNNASLQITLGSIVLRDPELFQTTASGTVQVQGPLGGGGMVRGGIDLGRTEVLIPSTIGGARGAIPESLRHLNEPGASRATRQRAGMTDGPGGAGASATARQALGIDLLIRAPNQIFVRGRGLDAELGGQLRLTGSTANIIPIGQFDLIRGRLDILGKRLTMQEGQISLQGAFDPYIRLVAATQADDTQVQVVTEGSISAPDVSFLSQPELPQDEILARLLFGRGIETLSAVQAAQLANAVATLAGRNDDGLLTRLRQDFGLDDFDVTTDDEGNAAVSAGKYLSRNVYTDVTIDSTGKSEIHLNLDVSPMVTLKGSLDSEGNTGVGAFYERDY